MTELLGLFNEIHTPEDVFKIYKKILRPNSKTWSVKI